MCDRATVVSGPTVRAPRERSAAVMVLASWAVAQTVTAPAGLETVLAPEARTERALAGLGKTVRTAAPTPDHYCRRGV